MKFEQLDETVWIASDHFVVGKVIDCGCRTTIIRLSDGGLWVHSPIALTSELQDKVNELGDVTHILLPNAFHHVFAKEWITAYPKATVTGTRAVAKKRSDLAFTHVLPDDKAPWGSDIHARVIQGKKIFDEAVCFHEATNTLILTDLVFNFIDAPNASTGLLLRFWGVYRNFGPSRLLRFLLKNTPEVRASVNTILSWDFQRIIMAHGNVLEANAKPAFKQAFQKYLT
jgi:hypothetical protein